MDVQMLVVLAIVAAAALYVGAKLRRTIFYAHVSITKGGKDCGDDCGCGH